MASSLYAENHYKFNFQLEYPNIEVGRQSGCDRPPPTPLDEGGELEGQNDNFDVCNMSRTSTSTDSNRIYTTTMYVMLPSYYLCIIYFPFLLI
jgi:hypothetical protein